MKKILVIGLGLMAAGVLTARAADGRELYEKQCAKCHGADGKGQTKMGQKTGAKDYTDPKVQAAVTDAAGIQAIKGGFKDKDGNVVMKPTDGVTDDEAKAMMAHLRTFRK